MKKIIFYSAAIGVIALSSCKKEYQCECESVIVQQAYDENGDPLGDPSTSNSTSKTTIKDKESDARTECNNGESVITQTSHSGGMTVKQTLTTECELK